MLKNCLLTLSALLIFTSCSEKFGVMKRRYNKGYYVLNRTKTPKIPVSGTHKQEKKVSGYELAVANQVQLLPVAEKVKEIQSAEEMKKASVSNTGKALATADKTTKTKRNIHNSSPAPFPAIQFKKALLNVSKNEIHPPNKGVSDDDVMLILLIILAIFTPPLAIYLKNESVNKWFWATLILCLLSFTALWFFFGGAFWLIAMVIALCYVLDAIH